MAEQGNHFDIQKILFEAQSRWLRPGEICEILRNHQSVGISVEPPNKPPSGSFFLFNREVLRGFRNDGHNWKKNKNGNAMKEGHEKLKVGGIDVLHCYYTRGEENESFKRRSYSMLDQAYKHIVFVQYLEVKDNKKILGQNGVTKEAVPSSLTSNSASFRCLANRNAPLPPMHITILNRTQISEHEAVESDGYKGRQPENSELNFVSCDQSKRGESFVPSFSFTQCATMELTRKQKSVVLGKSFSNKLNIKQEVVHRTSGQDTWKLLLDNCRTDELNKVDDSFTRWMSKELGKVDDLYVQTSSVAAANSSLSPQLHFDSYEFSPSPSISQEQLFSIIDFSPNWAYAGSEIKVMIAGKFLKSRQDVSEECKWACMFGDVEVPVEVLAHGVLRCKSPPHRDGKVPFYVTCSNRLACSEVREFEFRVSQTRDSDITDLHRGNTNDMLLLIRLGKLLSLRSLFHQKSLSSYVGEKPDISCKISSLMKEGDGEWMQTGDFSQGEVKEHLLQKILKERMHDWLLHKATEDGKGPCVLDEEGQGVIHLSAALGYDWAIAPTIAAGVNINFRDVNGWTALHWSAFYGRERTSVVLVSHGAFSGALTYPTPEFPLARTPADVASANGHKGIAGYLAESSLTSHLSSFALKEDMRDSDVCGTSNSKASETSSGLVATPLCDDSVADVSLKGSLTAYSVAAQAAALTLTSVKTHNTRQPNEPVHAAAVQIQSKFRGWKGRKEFLIIRQRIIKIQAHVRGHQVRKRYRKIIWSVGIVEKVILRWRRKGSGLRGFRLVADIEGTTQAEPSKDDEYDFLKEGRKQTEERLQKTLARLKSMVQYPDARDQYDRLLNIVTEFQQAKVKNDGVLNSSEEARDNGDAMTIDFEPFLRDDTFMSTVKSLLEFDDSSRRFVQKRVVSIPITNVDGSRLNGDGAPPSDSWTWRKYNQKLIEGSPYLRGYYRCSSSDSCPARKQVERSSVDPTMLVITYAYEHNHPSPASRNINSITTAATTTNNNITSAAPNKLLPEEPAVLLNQPEIQSNEKFVNLEDKLLVNTNDYGWFSDVASTSSTVLERPICLRNTNGLEANIPMITPMGEEDESLFTDLWEFPF